MKLKGNEKTAPITVPIQAIWGREDRIVPVAHSDGLPGPVMVNRLGKSAIIKPI